MGTGEYSPNAPRPENTYRPDRDAENAGVNLLEQAGRKNAKRTCKWLKWLPDFDFLTPVKWLALLLIAAAVGLAVWYGVAMTISNIRSLSL